MAEIFTGRNLDSQNCLSDEDVQDGERSNSGNLVVRQATCRLSADSAAHVRSEIQEHYESARDEALAGGASAHEADRTALASLGNARSAGRQYRKVLLTTAEDRLLRETTWEARLLCSRLRWMLPIPIAVVCAGIWLFTAGDTYLGLRLMVLAAGVGLLFSRPLLPINTPARAQAFRGARWAWLAIVVLLAVWPDVLKQSWLLVAIAWPIFWVEWTLSSVRRKLAVAQWPRPLHL